MTRTNAHTHSIRMAAVTFGVGLLTVGLLRHQYAISALGAMVGVAFGVSGRFGGRSPRTAVPILTSISRSQTSDSRIGPAAVPSPPFELPALVENMLANDRYALLLRPQIVQDLAPRQSARAASALKEGMSLVPAGELLMTPQGVKPGSGSDRGGHSGARWQPLWIDAVFIDRFAVSNRQFHQFVTGGGYDEHSLWDSEIWQLLAKFVDQTGAAGPRYWKDGRYERGWENHPVVGVSWFEAAAYARWVGKRLPSDAEWIKAGAWPVTLPDGTQSERTFPWGDAMDRSRANLWRSGPGFTAPVDAFLAGASVGDVRQLVGNVWEWTSGRLEGSERSDGGSNMERIASLRSLRGGAFDTYFDAQATCRFQSGDHPLSRKHNIGFRCALGVCDLQLEQAVEQPPHRGSAPLDAFNADVAATAGIVRQSEALA